MATLSSPTLDRLLRETRTMLGQLKATNSNWSDEELSGYLNDGIRKYFLEVSMRNEGQFTTQADLDIVQDVDTVALPSDFFEANAVYKKITNGYKILAYRQDISTSYDTNGGTNNNSYEPYYYFRNNNLVLRPGPNFAETGGIRIEYIAFPETLIWGGDTMSSSVSPVFKEVIILYAVYKAKVKESLVTGTNTYQAVETLLASAYKDFQDAVTLRSHYPQFIKPFSP